ncbi:hypothetical protein JCM6882_006267 [Rhodosporidiobolus microsporus]
MLAPILLLPLLPALTAALPFALPARVLVARQDDTGCNMNAGSELMQCLGSFASVPPAPEPTTGVIAEDAQQLCEMYTQIANCWGNGTFCREWLPVKTAADKICALAASASAASSATSASTTATSASSSASSSYSVNSTLFPSSLPSSITSNGTASSPFETLFSSLISSEASAITAVTASGASSASATATPTATTTATASAPTSVEEVASETFASVVAEASNVITSIWNNDSGTDIPSISNDIEPTQTNPTWTAAEVSQTGGWGPGNGNGITSQQDEGASGGAAVQSGSSGDGNAAGRKEAGGELLAVTAVTLLALLV